MKIKLLPGCILAATMALTTSCSDFLTEDPKGQLTPETLFKTKSDIDMSLNSLYSELLGLQCNSNSMIVQCSGDDVTSTVGSNKSAYLSSDAFETPTDNKGINELWSHYYNMIKDCNFVIDAVNYMKDVKKEEVSEALGQAYFWRAYAYYGLVRTWGPVPVSPEEVISVDLKNNTDEIPLTSVENLYAKIVADLKSADECNLPAQYTEANKSIDGANIYVSKQAVKSLLTAVYMSMAGYPLNKTEYYGLAADEAKEALEVMDQSGANTLLGDWSNVYNYGMNNHNECILGLYYNPVTGSWGYDDSQLTSCHVLQYYSDWQGWGDFLAERRFWKNYPDGPRKDCVFGKTLLTLDGNNVDWWATVDGEPVDEERTNAVITDYRPMYLGFSVNNDGTGGALAAPYDCTKPNYAGMTLGKRHQLIRYSEVLCWFAEASARSGKYLNEARAALKRVRQRAYSDQAKINEVDNLSGEALAEAAWNEHRYEVAGNVLATVTCREDLFRLNKLKDQFEYRVSAQNDVLVPAGTVTHSENEDGEAFTYTLTEDLKMPEEKTVVGVWNDNMNYNPYPPTEVEKNPYLHR